MEETQLEKRELRVSMSEGESAETFNLRAETLGSYANSCFRFVETIHHAESYSLSEQLYTPPTHESVARLDSFLPNSATFCLIGHI